MIYHIATEKEWEQCRNTRFYFPDGFKKDGFIHCSTRSQIERTANILFKSNSHVMLLCIDDKKEMAFIKYENLEGGSELFPHLYRKLPKGSIVKVLKITKSDTGWFNFPEEIIARA